MGPRPSAWHGDTLPLLEERGHVSVRAATLSRPPCRRRFLCPGFPRAHLNDQPGYGFETPGTSARRAATLARVERPTPVAETG
jgi:hypothetical protein